MPEFGVAWTETKDACIVVVSLSIPIVSSYTSSGVNGSDGADRNLEYVVCSEKVGEAELSGSGVATRCETTYRSRCVRTTLSETLGSKSSIGVNRRVRATLLGTS